MNIGTAPEILPVNLVKHGKQSTKKCTLNEVVGPSRDGLEAVAGPINENGSNKPQGVEKQRTWTRLAHMDYGPMETLKESTTPVLGKRLHHAQ